MLNRILDLELTKEEFETDDIQELSVDITDEPYFMWLTRTPEGKQLTIYERNEMNVYYDHEGVEKGKLMVNGEDNVTGTASEGSVGENLGAFYKACMLISKHFRANDLQQDIELLDFNKEGFLVEVSDGRILFSRVSGRKRPDLMCTSFSNPPRMTRPYPEEISGPMAKAFGGEKELLRLAEAGDESAMLSLGELYSNGDSRTEVNPEKAFYWFEKGANAGDPTAQYNLGLLYCRGFGTERDLEKAIYWMKKAEENGDPDAAGQVKSYEETCEWLKKAQEGSPAAQVKYAGFLMYMGKNDPTENSEKDFTEAVKWANLAAEQGEPDAFWVLGLAYEHGRGVKKDKRKAAEFFGRGASLNQPACMNSYAAYIRNGEVPGKTEEDAFRLFKKAAEMGDVHAMKNLGHCYQFEKGTDCDMKLAVYWYEKYLEHEEDEELALKVMFFKMMLEAEDAEDKDKDRDDEKDDREEDDSTDEEDEDDEEDDEEERENNLLRLRNVKKGDTCVFGKFPMNGSGKSQDLEWTVLDQSGTMLLLISRKIIGKRLFGFTGEQASWADSLIRDWLNTTFLQQAFNDAERRRILPITISENDSRGIPHRTEDRIFLLSETEVRYYMPTARDRAVVQAELPANARWGFRSVDPQDGRFQYCLKTGALKSEINSAEDVDDDRAYYYEELMDNTLQNDDYELGIRPVMWISVE